MGRFALMLRNEIKLFRTAIPIHLVAIFQPTLMYLLMGMIMVHPTFEMEVVRPTTPQGQALVAAMEKVGSPIGEPYIRPILIDRKGDNVSRQVIRVETQGDSLAEPAVAVQTYGLIDSNLVKNLRNRLTAAALHLWEDELGDRAVTIEEHPWLPHDIPYTVYFGMAMLPLAAGLAASLLGAFLTAQEFESGTIAEYRLALAPVVCILGARLARLVLLAYVSAGLMLVAVGLGHGIWPEHLGRVVLILLPLAIITGCVGIVAGLLVRKIIPAFLVALVTSFVGWILGSAFGLASGFSGWYERISRLTPFTHTVELLFPCYYGTTIGRPVVSALVLLALSTILGMLGVGTYRWRVMRQG